MKKLYFIPDFQLFADGGEGAAENAPASQEKNTDVTPDSVATEEIENENIADEEKDFSESPNGEADAEVENEGDTSEDEFNLQRQQRLRERVSGWIKQSRGVKELYPDFDLRAELNSSRLFSQLVLNGVAVKDAYETVHKDEILSGAMAYTAQKVREQMVKNIETKGRRPMENGISSESAVVTAVDVNSLTAKDIMKILKQVENGANIKF